MEEGNNPAGVSDVKGCSELPHALGRNGEQGGTNVLPFTALRIVCGASHIRCCLCKPLLSASPGLGVNIAPALAPGAGSSAPAPPAPPPCWLGMGWALSTEAFS